MIFTEKKITINNNQCKIDVPVVLYRGDYNVEVRFTIVSSPYKYSNKQETNVIEQADASYGQLVIQTPNTTPIFSEITATKKGAITFTITAEMIDEITEVGNYTFQIRLLDENKESRASIPEVVNGIEIREPIASEDVTDTNEVNVATVGYALTTTGTTEDAFDSQGNYNKTTWGTGDRITAAKLNKIEAGIEGVNQKANSVATLIPTKTSQLTNDSDFATETYVDTAIENIEITGGSGLTQTQINALNAMFQKCVFNGDVTVEYTAFKTAFGITDSGGENPNPPAEKTLSSISATYSGGDVPVGTVLTDLTGIEVVATYSDGSTETIADYVLSGEIIEGSNSITVTYNEKTTTFTVVGIAQVSEQGWTNGVPYEQPLIEGHRINNGVAEAVEGSYCTDFLPCKGVTAISASTGVVGDRQALYDQEKNFIGVTYNASPILIDRDAYYARFTPNNADCIFTPIAYPVYKEGMVWEADKYYSLSYIPGETVNALGNITSSNWWRTGYMYCYGATSIKWRTGNYSSGNANNRCKLAFFDSEKVFIQTIESQLADTAFTEIPNNSAYVILTRSDEVGTDNGYIIFS